MTIWLPEGETLPTLADAEAIAARIRAARPDAEVWLFGSLAHGRLRRGSDIDLAVVLPDAALEGRRVRDVELEFRRLTAPRHHDLDLVVFRRSRFAPGASGVNALEQIVLREGRRLP